MSQGPNETAAEQPTADDEQETLRRGATAGTGDGRTDDFPNPAGGTHSDDASRTGADRPEDEGDAVGYEDATAASTASAQQVEEQLGVRQRPDAGDADEGHDTDADRDDPRSRAELLAELTLIQQERDQYLDDLKRARAEFQNYRRRSEREGAQRREDGRTDVLRALVDVVDDFELAVLAAGSSEDVEGLKRGVEMVYGKLVDVLRSFGLEKVGRDGVPFDPERHDAVQKVDADEAGTAAAAGDAPVVVEVLRPGYMVKDRVIRAAMVKVAE